MKLCLVLEWYNSLRDHRRVCSSNNSYIPCTTTIRRTSLAKSTMDHRIVGVGICKKDPNLTKVVVALDPHNSLSLTHQHLGTPEQIPSLLLAYIEARLGSPYPRRNRLGTCSRERPRKANDCRQLFPGKVSSHCLLPRKNYPLFVD